MACWIGLTAKRGETIHVNLDTFIGMGTTTSALRSLAGERRHHRPGETRADTQEPLGMAAIESNRHAKHGASDSGAGDMAADEQGVLPRSIGADASPL